MPGRRDRSTVNRSRLMFRKVRPTAGSRCSPQPMAPDFPKAAAKVGKAALPAAKLRPRWDTLIQPRRAADERVVLAASEALSKLDPRPGTVETRQHKMDAALCAQPTVTTGANCCGYTLRDQVNNQDVWYAQPGLIFMDEATALEFVEGVEPGLPMILPYQDGTVYPSQGWLYDGGSFHGAIDYVKTSDAYGSGIDPAFTVHSIADGTVLSVVWDDWNGNVVVIEHVAPDGSRYRSAYFHLRDGLSHDVSEAQGVDPTSSAEAAEYKKYADKPNPDPLQWGTDAQTIQVAPGDTVTTGQLIGWSGNTGAGGANAGLDSNGNPTNPDTANNHLHFMMTVPHPDPAQSNIWIQVDPYGVYAQSTDDGCYDLLAETAAARLFAPFYPSFHNVPAAYVGHYWSYYTGMGMALQTLSLHRDGDDVLASGSFQWGLPSTWRARLYMSGEEYQQWFDQYHGEGFRPRQIQVCLDGTGQPRFTVIWQQRAGESYWAYHGVDDTEWQNLWSQHVDKEEYRVEDRVGYEVSGTRLGAAAFVSDGDRDFYEWHYLSGPDFQTTFNDLGSKGYRMVSVNVLEGSGGTTFGAVWRKVPGDWYARHGISPAEYQSEFDAMTAQGFRLYRIQGYADSELFAAIWCKGF